MDSAIPICVTVNGRDRRLDVAPNETLLDLLRERLALTGTKKSCGEGECGACTVLMDGRAVNSCLVLAVEADGCEVLTIEGLAEGDELHPLQEAFLSAGAVQCGFCTPGMIMSVLGLLMENPDPTPDDVKKALCGNLCRCTGYVPIIAAVQNAAEKMREKRSEAEGPETEEGSDVHRN
jgi:carbon-monoxide dehydrogenase small subunit